jgi:hypothetical protein
LEEQWAFFHVLAAIEETLWPNELTSRHGLAQSRHAVVKQQPDRL